MIQDIQLRVLPQIASDSSLIINYISEEKGIDARTIKAIRIIRRSIDARQRQVYVNLTVRTYVNEEPTDLAYSVTEYPDVSNGKQVIVVGEGPAGLFAALRLIEHGLRPIVIERGKDVRERKKDLARIKSEQKVNDESNYCFGEGGAGAYSDGKLYTRSKKRGNIEKILNVFCQFGASTNILADAHPHIGTDKLPVVIEHMREQIIKSGGEVHLQTKMTELLLKGEDVVDLTKVIDEKPIVEVSTSISDDYVDDEEIKILIHKKINQIDSYEKLESVKFELEDRFGKITDDMYIYMHQEWFEKLSKKLGITNVHQNKTSIDIMLTHEMTNSLNVQELFIKTSNIGRMFRFSLKGKCLMISLNLNNLDKHFIFYLIDLFKLIEENMNKEAE